MTRGEHMQWRWYILGILNDLHGTATLQEIYDAIVKDHKQTKEGDPHIINADLFTDYPGYGNRKRYQHSVRGYLSLYSNKEHLLERIGKGEYKITQAGLDVLSEYNKS